MSRGTSRPWNLNRVAAILRNSLADTLFIQKLIQYKKNYKKIFENMFYFHSFTSKGKSNGWRMITP